MSNLSELRQRAREYSGSYRIIEDGKVNIGGKRVSFIHYANPNNVTDAEYLTYKCGDLEGSTTITSSTWVLKRLESILQERGLI